MNNTAEKVICIGWQKTGTSTLGLALLQLGYTVVGARLDLEQELRKGNYSSTIQIANEYGAVQDMPWAALFRELDSAFPGARFIFTDRDDASWIRSAVSHFGTNDISLHEWLYGCGVCVGNEELYLERFRKHRFEVKEWFANRPHDLLEMNFEHGAGWEVLCKFLNHPVPNKAWPHINKGKHSLSWWEHILNSFRRTVPMPLRKALFHARLRVRALVGLSDPRNRFNNLKANRWGRRKPR